MNSIHTFPTRFIITYFNASLPLTPGLPSSLFALANLRKVTISSCLSVRPFFRMENSAPTGQIFMKFYIRVFRKSVEKIQV